MAFQINSNVSALNVYNNLTLQQTKVAVSLAKISSGLKAAGGDVASQATAASLSLSAQATQASIMQVQTAINGLQAADTAFGELIALGQKGLDVAGGLAGADATTQASLEAQLAGIAAGIGSIEDNTEFNGALLSALADPDVGLGVYSVAPAFATAPSAETLGEYTTYVGAAVDARATNAANLAAMQSTLQILNAVAANEMAGIGQAQDTDIAKEMMNLTAANIMTEAATAMLAQAMQMPNAVLKLVQ
jgi:flagellin